jgi:hypothetical protein
MTKHARKVLQDCTRAVALFTENHQNEDFRIHWASVIVLLRTVGHVLEKIDAKTDPTLGKAVSQKWQEIRNSKPEPEIYWGFIEKERNNILKQYEFGALRIAFYKKENGVLVGNDISTRTNEYARSR